MHAFTATIQIKLDYYRLLFNMFTGLIEEIGTVRVADPGEGSTRFLIDCEIAVQETARGDSIAVNGCCLTVTELSPTAFAAVAVFETLSLTNLGDLKAGSRVNLERSITPLTRMGGHMVQGHVDGTGKVLSIDTEGDSQRWTFSVPPDQRRYLVKKGSIAVNGVSLTIADVAEASFSVALIPETIAATTFQFLSVGDRVNIETDILGKYIYQYMQAYQQS